MVSLRASCQTEILFPKSPILAHTGLSSHTPELIILGSCALCAF